MKRPKLEDFKVKYTKGIAETASVIKQYSKAQELYIDQLEQLYIDQLELLYIHNVSISLCNCSVRCVDSNDISICGNCGENLPEDYC